MKGKNMKILLVCNAGMSSSILVKKIIDYAHSIGEELYVDAVSSANLDECAGKYDVCLVGPQIEYALSEISMCLKIPTEVIDMRIYAVVDGKGAYEQALRMKGKK